MDKLQWGSKKRLRCIKVEDDDDDKNGGFMKRSKIKSRVYRRAVERDNNNQSYPTSISLRDLGINRSSSMENQKIATTSASPDKEDRYYTTRGSVGGLGVESAKLCMEVKEDKNNKQKIVWPKLYISLSSKEKEEDFMAMKGCKLPQRPKKRAKLVQRTLLLVSPGAWLSDLCQERYEVREKKASKKRPRGLKAMGGMESDSE